MPDSEQSTKEFFVVVKGFGRESRDWYTAVTEDEAIAKAKRRFGIEIIVLEEKTDA